MTIIKTVELSFPAEIWVHFLNFPSKIIRRYLLVHLNWRCFFPPSLPFVYFMIDVYRSCLVILGCLLDTKRLTKGCHCRSMITKEKRKRLTKDSGLWWVVSWRWTLIWDSTGRLSGWECGRLGELPLGLYCWTWYVLWLKYRTMHIPEYFQYCRMFCLTVLVYSF